MNGWWPWMIVFSRMCLWWNNGRGRVKRCPTVSLRVEMMMMVMWMMVVDGELWLLQCWGTWKLQQGRKRSVEMLLYRLSIRASGWSRCGLGGGEGVGQASGSRPTVMVGKIVYRYGTWLVLLLYLSP